MPRFPRQSLKHPMFPPRVVTRSGKKVSIRRASKITKQAARGMGKAKERMERLKGFEPLKLHQEYKLIGGGTVILHTELLKYFLMGIDNDGYASYYMSNGEFVLQLDKENSIPTVNELWEYFDEKEPDDDFEDIILISSKEKKEKSWKAAMKAAERLVSCKKSRKRGDSIKLGAGTS